MFVSNASLVSLEGGQSVIKAQYMIEINLPIIHHVGILYKDDVFTSLHLHIHAHTQRDIHTHPI